MTERLVRQTFRYGSGALAKQVHVSVVARGLDVELKSLSTDTTGSVAFYVEPGQYDYLVFGTRIPFDVEAAPETSAGRLARQFATPSATWTWPHGLGTKPDVLLFTDSLPGEPQITDVTYPDLNTLVIEWPSAESGWAYI